MMHKRTHAHTHTHSLSLSHTHTQLYIHAYNSSQNDFFVVGKTGPMHLYIFPTNA